MGAPWSAPGVRTRVPSVTGTFTRTLVAGSADGVAVRVPLTIGRAHEIRTLTVHLVDRDGAPATHYSLSVVGVDQQVSTTDSAK